MTDIIKMTGRISLCEIMDKGLMNHKKGDCVR